MPVPCPNCDGTNTVGHFEHPAPPLSTDGGTAGPGAPPGSGVHVWEAPTELDPLTGIPQPKPCPNCGGNNLYPPQYLKCLTCGHQWNP